MPKPTSKNNLLQFAVIFFIVYFSSQLVIKLFFPSVNTVTPKTGIELQLVDAKISQGNHPDIRIINNGTGTLTISAICPELPVEVFKLVNNEPQTITPASEPLCDVAAMSAITIEPGAKEVITLSPWKYALFSELGTYELRLQNATVQLQVVQPNALVGLFRTVITKPFLNALVLLASWLPGHSLGWAIVILTIVIKLILYIPTQSALKGQKKMQELQPKIEALRKKFKNDPQALNKATLELWKQEKVNPFQSCAPLLIQFPVLLGLFYVVRDGVNLQASQHLLYVPFQNLDWTFGTQFLGLNLLQPDIYVMPVLLVALQFFQLKLSFAQSKKKQAKQPVVDVAPAKDKKNEPLDPQQMQQKFMLYGLPLMIGVFAIQFPAAVAVYWAISTLFAVAQQLVVNSRS